MALAQAADLLRVHFSRGELRGRKVRVKALTSGEGVGKATQETSQAMRAAAASAIGAAAAAASAAG